jgi:hypothetical protein
MIRAAGALVTFMQNNRLLFGELDGEEVLRGIKTVEQIKL